LRLEVQGLCWGVDGRDILHDIQMSVDSGAMVGLIGPNGSGKSSLLRCVYRALKPRAGSIAIDGDDLWSISSKEAARRIAVVLQETPSEFDFTAYEIVSMGRNPHKQMFDRANEQDNKIIEDALDRVGMTGFDDRNFATLSGGEKQRILIARSLSQQASFLLLDEPTNHLDIRYQLEIMNLVKELGLSTLAALHDLNIATEYCDKIYVIDDGRIVASGPPSEVLEPPLIKQVFGVGASVDHNTHTGKPRLNFYLDRNGKDGR
jgi:iron complex transport system ATP-binding protein